MKETMLIDYLRGNLEQTDCNKVESWYNQSSENKKKLEDLYFILFISDRIDAIKDIDKNKAFEEFKHKLKQKAAAKRVSLVKRVASIAAIFLGIFLIGSTTTLLLLNRDTKQISVTTHLGERARVTLPDGTNVWLNACSNLEYKKRVLSRKREVALSGEGYFEVEAKKRSPFIVSNNTSSIEVLGTKFNVKCNSDEDFITTSLLEGSVLFAEEYNNLKVKLKPGEEIVYDRLINKYTIQPIQSNEDITAWLDGKIIFTNAALEDIAKKLERHYNVKITFADEMVKKERFNADFDASDNIYQIISILEGTKRFRYKLDSNKREIIISSINNK